MWTEFVAMSVLSLLIIIVLPIAIWIYTYRKGVRWSCPNCAQRQTGWSRCGVVFKDWKE